MAQDLDRVEVMTDVRVRGTYRRPSAEPSTAEDCIYQMPTVAEVVRAGYSESYWGEIKAERDAFIRKFNSDPVFRAEAIADAKRVHSERAAHEVRRKLDLERERSERETERKQRR